MRWNTVIPAWLGLIEANSDVQSVIGDPTALYQSGDREHEVPSMEWTLIVPGLEAEVFETALVQLDFFTATMADLETLQEATRSEVHKDLRITAGGILIKTRFAGGRPLPGAKKGTHAGSLDFELEYVRSRWS